MCLLERRHKLQNSHIVRSSFLKTKAGKRKINHPQGHIQDFPFYIKKISISLSDLRIQILKKLITIMTKKILGKLETGQIIKHQTLISHLTQNLLVFINKHNSEKY